MTAAAHYTGCAGGAGRLPLPRRVPRASDRVRAARRRGHRRDRARRCWWAACIAAVGLLLAVAGLVVSVVALLGDERSSLPGASRPAAIALGVASAIAIVAALVAA